MEKTTEQQKEPALARVAPSANAADHAISVLGGVVPSGAPIRALIAVRDELAALRAENERLGALLKEACGVVSCNASDMRAEQGFCADLESRILAALAEKGAR